MGKKKKKKSTPAVGHPAAGSNNKEEKLISESALPAEKTEEKDIRTDKHHEKTAADLPQEKAIKQNVKNQEKKEKAKQPKRRKKEIEKKPETFKEKLDYFVKNYNIAKVAAALLIVIMIFAGTVSLIVSASSDKIPAEIKKAEYKGRKEPSSSAFDIDISPEQQKKLSKAVKAKGRNSAFDFYVNEEINIGECTDPVLLEFGSVEKNKCDLVVFLLDEDGNIIYRSLGIEAGKQLRSVFFFDEVKYGTQTLTLVVNGYNKENFKKVGTQTAHIRLKIGGEKNEEK